MDQLQKLTNYVFTDCTTSKQNIIMVYSQELIKFIHAIGTDVD